MGRNYLLGVAYAGIALFTTNVIAADKYWSCGDGAWADTSCWNPVGQPLLGDNVYLTQSDSVNRTVTYGLPEAANINTLNIDATGTGTMTFSQYTDIFSYSEDLFTRTYIGFDGTGTYNQYGGIYKTSTNIDSGIYLGYNSSAIGTYNLYDGGITSDYSTNHLFIGYDGTGYFNQFGGNVSTRRVFVGTNDGASGTYNLSGGGIGTTGLILGGNESYSASGSGAIGVFNQNGGDVFIDTILNIAWNSTYNLSDGKVWFGGDAVVISNGTFNQTGGDFVGPRGWDVGDNILNGVYNLSGGSSQAYDESIHGTFNQSGGVRIDHGEMKLVGTYNLSGGSLSLEGSPYNSGDMTVDSGGTFNLDDGTVVADNTYIGLDDTGTFNQSGGTFDLLSPIDGSVYLGYNTTATGTYNLYDGVLGDNYISKSGDLYVGYDGTGIFNQYGGSTLVSRVYVGTNSGSNGTYNLVDGYIETSGLYLGYNESLSESGATGTFNQSGGYNYIDGDLYIAANSTYNLSGGDVQFDGDAKFYLIGTFNQSNGDFTVVEVHDIIGEYNLSGGTYLSFDTENITGTFNQSGGARTSFSSIDIDGTYNLTDGSLDLRELVVNAGGSFNFDGGTLSVDNFTGDLINNGGTLAPRGEIYPFGEDSLGITNITGDYFQSIDGIFEVEIAGLLQGDEYDALNVSGTATLGGILDVNFLDSGLFTPTLGDSFDILFADTIIGEFDLLQLAILGEGLDWDVSYIFDDISIDIVRLSVVNAVPIPSAAWLFGSGLIGLIGLARRKTLHLYQKIPTDIEKTCVYY